MRSWQGWSLVAIQFVLLALLILLPGGSLYPVGSTLTVVSWVLVGGGILLAMIAGARLGGSLTPSPIPRASGELATSGVYRVVRHPIYSALLLVGLGLAIRGASLWHALVLAGLLVLLQLKARAEEAMLLKKFQGYASYAARVGRFVPGVGMIRD
jgi:protein-S-isoprenylcysteine O-methyltransferase Ste14